MSRSRTSATLAVALTAGTLAVVPLSSAAAQAATVDVQVLGINDFHGRLEPVVAKREATADVPARAAVGGAAYLAAAVESYRTANPNTIFVSAGDNIGASPFVSAVQEDEPTIEVLNAMGLAVSAVGNHEFDRGYADLAGRVEALTDFPTLGANVEGEDPDMAPSFVVESAGVSVGFVGVVTGETASLVSPDGIRGITFSDPVAAANEAADALTDGDDANGEADVLVLLAHEGAAVAATEPTDCTTIATADDAFGEIVRGIDPAFAAVLGGHTHLEVDCEVPGLGRTVPLQVLEAQSYGTAMDVLTLTVDPATGAVTAATGEVVGITSDAFPEPDAAVQALVDEAVAAAEEVGKQPIGSITQDITRARTAEGEEDRGAESLLGNFIADVQLAATRAPGLGGAQIAFMNPGGLRADLLFESSEGGEGDGVVTYAELAEVQPFANGVITMTLTGQQVKDVLEEQFQPDGSSRPFLALGVSEGFRYAIDAAQPRGSRITDITLNGAPLDLAADYRVAVNSFLASGGDNFGTLAEGTERLDGGFNDLNLLVEHLRENSPITPSTADRAVVAGTEPVLHLERLAGADRFGTAAQVALETFGAASEALLSNGSASADALAGSYLAGVRSAPVLLTTRDTVPGATLEALRRLGSETVTILGGTDVVGAGVVSALQAEGLTVQRIGAADRYATAAAIATAAPTAVGEVGGLRTAVLANGLSPVDALVAGAPAYAVNLPVLLTVAGDLSPAAASALEELEVERVLVVGGTTVVSEAVVTDLEALGVTVQRLAGDDRRLTALAVADYAKANLGFVDTLVVLARGDDPADALVGGPRAGRDGAPILLTQGTDALGAVNADYLAAGCDTLFDGRVLGGTAAVAASVVEAAIAASECAAG